MRFNLLLFFLVSAGSIIAYGQNSIFASVNIGDPAPPLKVREWIKGTPVQKFEIGHVYVIEFWATWCKPCIAVMPHLSALAREYGGNVTIIGIDIYERKSTSIQKIKHFVDSMGHRMDYYVALDDSNFMVTNWIYATGEQDSGIPSTFVVDGKGRLAWIGHPKELIEVLPQIVSNNWKIEEELARRNWEKKLNERDDSLNYELMKYNGNPYKQGELGKPDSALLVIHQIVKNEPRLKYAPHIASYTFSSLLKTDQHKAHEYGREMLRASTYKSSAYSAIISQIEWYSDRLNLSTEIYELGADAYQLKIDKYSQFGNMNIPKNYYNMAEMYWHAKNKVKAIETIQKAIEALKIEKEFSKKNMETFEMKLQQYKKM